MSKVSLVTNINSHHVIVIHGLNFEKSEDPFSNFNLPIYLKKNFQHANVWKFYYSESSSISDIADDLIEEIKKMHLDEKSKIVFIAHSLGGIVIKESVCKLDLKENKILDHIKGVVFLSTPHEGSILADKLIPVTHMRMVGRRTVNGINIKIIQQLEKNNKYLKNLDKIYSEICNKIEYDLLNNEYVENYDTEIKNIIDDFGKMKKKLVKWRMGSQTKYRIVEKREIKPKYSLYKGKIFEENNDHFSIKNSINVYKKIEEFLKRLGI